MELLSHFPSGPVVLIQVSRITSGLEISHVLGSFPVLNLNAEVTYPSIRLKPVPQNGW